MRANKNNSQVLSEVSIIVSNALAEDIGDGDITCEYALNKETKIKAVITSKDNNVVVCGLEVIKEVFRQVDRGIKVVVHVKEGSLLGSKTAICTVTGEAEGILKAERTALNFLGRLSGIATQTKMLTDKIRKYKTLILDTRKTTPGIRVLEKYAVKIGGGSNHRYGLYDQVLIKDNHLRILKKNSSHRTLCDIIKTIRINAPRETIIEIEVSNIQELKDALTGEPDIIMLDNMDTGQMKKAVSLRNKVNKNIKLEASGNITGKNIKSVAICGVDFISMGALTHSVKCVDFSLNVK
ncbi:MAG: carboxylating nicotinate-nucleotide diphosphorylase [Candidatus Omnitrophica bacterium]|nr:carboxylating nicotinate-nucleotide diphosphorylase [Candidatus Omnitrophota bacterium]